MTESKKISPHQVLIFSYLQKRKAWVTNHDVALATGVSYRTASLHTKRLRELGILEHQEVFPTFLFRYAANASQRAGSYIQRLKAAAAALSQTHHASSP